MCEVGAFRRGNLRQKGPAAAEQQQRLVAAGISCKQKARKQNQLRLAFTRLSLFWSYSRERSPVLQISWKMRSSSVLVMRPVLLTELSSLDRAQSNSCACLERTATLISVFSSFATAYVRTQPTAYGHTCLWRMKEPSQRRKSHDSSCDSMTSRVVQNLNMAMENW